MKKILVGFIIDGQGGGIDKYLLNFLENVHTKETQIDFLTNEISPELKHYLQKYHSRIFAIPNLKHPVGQYREVCKILQREQYDVVYLNISTAIDCITALAAKAKKVPRILIHSHTSGNDLENPVKRMIYDTIHKFCRLFLYRTATAYYGCSEKAGLWMFPSKIVKSDKFQTVFNAVDLNKFMYKDSVRNEVRKELNLENKFVVGHVGNFVYQKNHYFLIDIFEKLREKFPDAILLLIGKGERFETVKKLIQEKGLEDSVRLLGFRKDSDRIFQAMDFFLLPSYFEGLPTVGVEAQCTGLPCLMSDTITREVKITENCWFLPLKEKPEIWAEFILNHRRINREHISWIGKREAYSLETLKQQQKKLLEK